MQIESLDLSQKLASKLHKNGSQAKSSFTNFLQSVTTAVKDTASSGSKADFNASDVKDTLSLLSKEDILDLEDGLKLLDQLISDSNSNEELLTMIENYLGISHTELQTLLASLTDKLRSESGEGQSDLSKLLQVVDLLSKLSASELSSVLNKDSLKLIKAAKLYDLLSKNQDSGSEQMGKADFKSLSNHLTSILDGGSLRGDQNASRLAFLRQTFSNISTSSSLKEEPTTASIGRNDMVSGSVQFLQMSRPEQLTLTLPTGSKQVQTEQLIKQFESILARSQFSNVNGVQRLFLQLNPNNLGSMRIEIVQQDSILMAKIVTSTHAAKEALEGQLNHLKQAFNSQNIQVDRLEIMQQSSNSEKFLNRDGQQQQSGKEEAERKEEHKSDKDFNASFEEALLNTEA